MHSGPAAPDLLVHGELTEGLSGSQPAASTHVCAGTTRLETLAGTETVVMLMQAGLAANSLRFSGSAGQLHPKVFLYN